MPQKKVKAKKKFIKSISYLRRLKPQKQREMMLNSSNEFIRDISSFLAKIRKRPDLVTAKHRKVLKKHRNKLRKLVHAKTGVQSKRLILSQKGGIIPFLIPIITAVIGGASSIAAGATTAAILKR